jgi:hypothetical protein
MDGKFHQILNRMAIFALAIVAGIVIWRAQFMELAAANIWLNGLIIGVTIFGIGLSFANVLFLVPEYNWMRRFFSGRDRGDLPPRILRPVATMLMSSKSQKIPSDSINGFLEIIFGRFEDQRETVRYITNVLVFLGLVGTFWGLISTVGGFADLVSALSFDDEDVMIAMQAGLAAPLSGMRLAFASSLFGLTGSLIVGFLGLQMQLSQNAFFRELEESLSYRARMNNTDDLTAAAQDLSRVVGRLDKTIDRIRL